jgi:hypothetical protein
VLILKGARSQCIGFGVGVQEAQIQGEAPRVWVRGRLMKKECEGVEAFEE